MSELSCHSPCPGQIPWSTGTSSWPGRPRTARGASGSPRTEQRGSHSHTTAAEGSSRRSSWLGCGPEGTVYSKCCHGVVNEHMQQLFFIAFQDNIIVVCTFLKTIVVCTEMKAGGITSTVK